MNEFTREISWVYIAEKHFFFGKRHIMYCSDASLAASVAKHEEQGERVVYYRRFDNVFDALAHKLMLESLSHSTVSYLIKKQAHQDKKINSAL